MATSESKRAKVARKIASVTYGLLRWGDERVPFGVRSVVGIAFMVGGVFGAFPGVGFWMLPLGFAFVGLDIPWTRHKVRNWMRWLKARAEPRQSGEQATGAR